MKNLLNVSNKILKWLFANRFGWNNLLIHFDKVRY